MPDTSVEDGNEMAVSTTTNNRIPSNTNDSTNDENQSDTTISSMLERSNKNLEQLASANKIIIRIRWKEKNKPENNTNLLAILENLIKSAKGYIVEKDFTEKYEYMADSSRLKFLEKNLDVYTFEQGSEEFFKWSLSGSQDLNNIDISYDEVIEGLTKRTEIFDKLCSDIKHTLQTQQATMSAYSISINKKALTHPGNLYIRGIPKDLAIDDLVPIFDIFGKILSLKIICDPITGKSLGYGFLSFQLGSEAAKCISKLNGTSMNGCILFINYHVERKEREKIFLTNFKENNDDTKFKGIFIGNLPKYSIPDESTVTSEDIMDKISLHLESRIPKDNIVSYYFPRQISGDELDKLDKDSFDFMVNSSSSSVKSNENVLKGYGFIKFEEHSQALTAIKLLENFEIYGKKLVVNKAVQAKNQKSVANTPPRLRLHHSDPYTHYASHQTSRRRASENIVSRNNNPSPNISSYFQPQHHKVIPTYFDSIHPSNFSPMGYVIPSSTIPVGNSPNLEPSLFISPNAMMAQKHYMTPYYPYANINTMNKRFMPSRMSAPNLRGGISMLPINQQQYYNFPSNNVQLPSYGPYTIPAPTTDQQESNIYVKNLPLDWKDEDLYSFYEKFGPVISAKIITVGGSKSKKNNESDAGHFDSSLGSSKGYGFVYFKNPVDASRAILATDGLKIMDDIVLYVSFAQKKDKGDKNGQEK